MVNFERARVSGRVPQGLSRVLRAMRARPGRAQRLSDLATVACVSTRSLQRQFKIFLGKTPLAVLRDIRFDCARRELLRGTPGSTVSEIAYRFGFEHLGRFSGEYRRRYGEKPSQTLDRLAFVDEPASKPHIFASMRDRASVTVLAFESAPRDQALARATADELVMSLMRVGIPVVTKPGVAQFHLRGVLRPDKMQMSLTLRLFDVATTRLVCAHSQGIKREDVANLGEELTSAIVATMQPALRATEIENARRTPESELTAHDLTMRALPYASALDREGNQRAIDLLERAMIRNPEHGLAIGLLAWCQAQRAAYQFSRNPLKTRELAISLALRASRMSDAAVLAVAGHALGLMGELAAADYATRKSLALDGGLAWGWTRSGLIEICKGRVDAALERLSIALDLSADDPLGFNNVMTVKGFGIAHFHTGRYTEAVRCFERVLAEQPSILWIHQLLCPAYILSGRSAEARGSVAALRQYSPDMTISRVMASLPFTRNFVDRVASGLETAGLPL